VKYFKILLVLGVVIGAGSLFFVGIGSQGSSQGFFESQGFQQNGFLNGSLNPSSFLSVVECSDEGFDSCYANTNDLEDWDAKAVAVILTDNFQYVERNGDSYRVEPGAGVRYDCIGSQAYFVPSSDSSSVDISADRDGLSSSEKELSDSGFIDFEGYDVDEGFQVVCASFDEGSDGSWASTWVSSVYPYKFSVVSDGDGDGLYDFEDSCPSKGDQGFGLKENGCPVVDSDGDGVADPSDDCLEESGLESLNGCPNSKPVIEGLSVPDSVVVNESVSVSVSASDNDSGQELSFYWSNGDVGSSSTYVFDELGFRRVSVTVGDGFSNVSRTVMVDVLRPEPSDVDGDGVPNVDDRCPGVSGSKFWSGCDGFVGFLGSFF